MDAIFFLFSFLILGFIIHTLYKGIIEKKKNDKAPILRIPVVVVEKRVITSTSTNSDNDLQLGIRTKLLLSIYRMEFGIHLL